MSGIGEQLRTAREAKGLSISDIEKATKIQGRYLEAIENNEFDKLPGDFYVRAFIRQYAQVVGLDGKELLSQYSGDIEEELEEHEKEVEAEKQEEEPVEAPTEQVYQPATARQKQIAKEENYKEEKQDAKWRKLVPKLALGCGIVLIVVIAVLVFANNKKSSSNSAEKASSSITITSSKKSSSKKSSSASSSSKKTSTIKVQSLGNSAFRVTGIKSSAPLVVRSSKQAIYYYVSVNNAITNQGTLQSGEKHTETVKNGSTLIVYLGTDTGVTVTIGGKKIPFTQVNGTSRLTIYLGANNNSTTGSSTSSSSSSNYSRAASSSYSSRTYSSQPSASQASSQTQSSHASSSQAQSSQASSRQAQSSQAQSSSKAQ